MKNYFALAALAAFPYLASATTLPQAPEQWRQAAIDDIEAGYRITQENHPGTYDQANPGFAGNLAAARTLGLRYAAKVTDARGYEAAILAFHARVKDGHAGMYPSLPAGESYQPRWPGFVAAWRGDGLYVYAATGSVPAKGSRVVSCDGVPIRELVKSNVFAFLGREEEDGMWWGQAGKLFLDWGNPFINLPKRCRFEHSGKQSDLTLNWTPRSKEGYEWLDASQNGDQLPIGLSEPQPGLIWAAMPSFHPDEQGRAAYQAMFDEMKANRQRLLSARAVVADLRHNGGGSSLWSLSFSGALWGEARVQRRVAAYFARTETWYRASKENVQFFASLADQLHREGQVEPERWARELVEKLQPALQRGDIWAVSKGDAEAPAHPEADVEGDPAPFTRPLYVIVPGQCASACLDALDYFTRFPNTKLIGAPSSADSTYMEVRRQQLDSGRATVIVPTKVYVNRPRGNGEFYQPAITVSALEWSTQNLVQEIEADLKKR
ncbi:S41 family peptidase [Pseudoduganella ginsengisoli]|uniref:Uncharacterized protein n=1 Tax=Pseudoduganella ginsengisoli TaxID=1462440 RepID=A0A6L6Q3E0_9BURK|nr:S41 family peptidase [Pseudoduganella ginsengisoli]MTW03811.1 hypothetical protein [Pseudoduganella ginsengisoli]